MNNQEADELKRQVRFLRDTIGVTVLLVEHNMSVVMSVCDRVHVVDHGETIAEGPPEAIQKDPRVLAAYLGHDLEGRTSADAEAPSA
jgi:branched-chain amino acid transport system ATP-binding protein